MFIVDFKDNEFQLKIEDNRNYYSEDDSFFTYTSFLRRINIFFCDKKYWKVPYDRIDEIVMWFDYHEYEYILMPQAIIAYDDFKKNNFKNECSFIRTKKFDENILTKNVIKFDYFLEGCNWGIKRSRAYIADDAGLGKTAESISVVSQLFKEDKIDGIFCIVRKGTSYNWKKEFLNFSNVFKEEDICIILNENKERPFEHNLDKKVMIVSNHLLGWLFASYRKDYAKVKQKLSTKRWNKPIVNLLEIWKKKSLVFIIDEAHEFKNTKALKRKALNAHKQFFNYRYLLSATPAINNFEDYWSQINLLDNGIIPYSENAFKIYIAKEIGDNYSPYTIKEYNTRHILNIKNIISPYIIQRLKKELPEVKTKQTQKAVYVEFSSKHKLLYEIFTKYALNKLSMEYANVSLKLIFNKFFPYLLQIIDNPLLLENKINDNKFNKILNTWKLEDDSRFEYLESSLKTYIEDFNEKVIVFDTHPKTLNLLYEKFKKYNPILVHGETKDTEKSKQEKQDIFNDKNSKNKLFLLSSLIGGASWNLHKACRREIVYTLPYDTTLTRQLYDRVWRITSEQDSIIEMLVLDHSIDYIRYLRNVKRIEINDNFLNKNLNENELNSLFSGILITNK